MAQGKRTYIVGLRTGILDPKHVNGIGPAIWEFMWCVDRTTKEENHDGALWGKVLGGKVVTCEKIRADLGTSERTVRRHMDRLEKKRYIRTKRTLHGITIEVRNSQRNFDAHSAKRTLRRMASRIGSKR